MLQGYPVCGPHAFYHSAADICGWAWRWGWPPARLAVRFCFTQLLKIFWQQEWRPGSWLRGWWSRLLLAHWLGWVPGVSRQRKGSKTALRNAGVSVVEWGYKDDWCQGEAQMPPVPLRGCSRWACGSDHNVFQITVCAGTQSIDIAGVLFKSGCVLPMIFQNISLTCFKAQLSAGLSS